jgi:hypothetical protein
MITYQNYTDNKQKSYKIMVAKMLAAFDKVKCVTENIRNLKLGGGQAYDRSSV